MYVFFYVKNIKKYFSKIPRHFYKITSSILTLFWIPLLAPMMGGGTGALVYLFGIGAHWPEESEKNSIGIKNSAFHASVLPDQ